MKAHLKFSLVLFFTLTITISDSARGQSRQREELLMDRDWRFSLGHAHDYNKDFGFGTSEFSSFAKAGFGDGPASARFDDRAWRKLDLPHDWAVEAPFDKKGSTSHGSKAIGRNFPERSIGWYRKSFFIPSSDDGRHISIRFDGVFRNSSVWINGHFLGIEPSGYSSFSYDLTDYLNYGGNNIISVRVDASAEEGWFYEGAGIYRHVHLTKTNATHVQENGTFITSTIQEKSAIVSIKTSIENTAKTQSSFSLRNVIVDRNGNRLDSITSGNVTIAPGNVLALTSQINLATPKLWSLDEPYLYRMITILESNGKVLDLYETKFGIRSIHFDPDKGMQLNGKPLKLKGTNNHQDHAGVGTAIPDELQRYRIQRLKEIGCNAYRCSHNPPTPELLDACDELGMLVIDENRLMSTSDQGLKELQRMLIRDRNHPSIILWSLGNEEWGMEGTDTGRRVAARMLDFARQSDTTRLYTTAISGGWGKGISTAIEVMGYNYISHGNTDQHHLAFPKQPGVGTEEGATFATRGIYADDRSKSHLNAYDWDPTDWGSSAEEGWTYYNSRDYLAGMFVWSGFDYRGEPTPFGWPANVSQFGILDLCGFPKDNAFYYKSWWDSDPMVHLFPHWNSGENGWSKGDTVKVWVHSNCEEIELFLNKKSLGRKKNKKDSHCEWKVVYTPGEIKAVGYINGRKAAADEIQTTGAATKISLEPQKREVNANGEDLAIITVSELDSKNRSVPNSDDEIVFTISGPGKIIGVGNGNPSSLEPDRFVEQVTPVMVTGWKVKPLAAEESVDVKNLLTDSWATGFNWQDDNNKNCALKIYAGQFELPKISPNASIKLFLHSVGAHQDIYINGTLLQEKLVASSAGHEIILDPSLVSAGKNSMTIVAAPMKENRKGGENPASIQLTIKEGQWKRKLFNGLAQVIVQSTNASGEIVVNAKSGNLTGEVRIISRPAVPRPFVESAGQ